MGIEGPQFDDDSGPKSLEGILEYDDPEGQIFPKDGNSLDKAELMIGSLLDAEIYLTSTVHDYKRSEIEARIDEILAAASEHGTPDMQTIDRIVELKKLLDQLEKDVRRTFPQWRVTKN